MTPFEFTPAVDRLIDMALEEDIGPGDITTMHTIAADAAGRAVIVAKEDLVIAGLAVAQHGSPAAVIGGGFDAKKADALVAFVPGDIHALYGAEDAEIERVGIDGNVDRVGAGVGDQIFHHRGQAARGLADMLDLVVRLLRGHIRAG